MDRLYKENTKLEPIYRIFGVNTIEYLRLILFSVVNRINNYFYNRKFRILSKQEYDSICYRMICAGILGASLHHAIRIIKKSTDIKGKKILIIGCGDGKEIHRWIKEKPKKIVAVEYLDYLKEWKEIKYSNVSIYQTDIKNFKTNEKFDIITSKAVLEHINELEKIFPNIITFLKKGGYFWADFGPLYYTWGGPHAPLAYDHLLYSNKEYYKRLKRTKSEKGILFWENNLFSRLKYDEYMSMFNKYLKKIFLGIEISQEAQNYIKRNNKKYKQLNAKYDEKDLLIKSIFYLGKKQK